MQVWRLTSSIRLTSATAARARCILCWICTSFSSTCTGAVFATSLAHFSPNLLYLHGKAHQNLKMHVVCYVSKILCHIAPILNCQNIGPERAWSNAPAWLTSIPQGPVAASMSSVMRAFKRGRWAKISLRSFSPTTVPEKEPTVKDQEERVTENPWKIPFDFPRKAFLETFRCFVDALHSWVDTSLFTYKKHSLCLLSYVLTHCLHSHCSWSVVFSALCHLTTPCCLQSKQRKTIFQNWPG